MQISKHTQKSEAQDVSLNTAAAKQPTMRVHFTRAHILLSLFLIIISSSGGLTEAPPGFHKVWDAENQTISIVSAAGTWMTIEQLSTTPDLTTFTEILNVTAYKNHPLVTGEDFKFGWKQHSGKNKNSITHTELFKLENQSYDIVVDEYETIQVDEPHYNNVTETYYNITVNQTIVSGSHTETRYKDVWREWTPAGNMLFAGDSVIVKVVYHKPPELGDVHIQTIPTFMGVECDELTWWNTSWDCRRKLTIDHSMVDATMSNFPTMVSITQMGLNTDGNDTRVTDSSGNQVAREIECYNATSGKLVFFFNGTSISDTSNTSFWMYYNNPAATEPNAGSTYGSHAVWSSEVVYLMNDDPTGTIYDSTSNANNATTYGSMVSEDLVDGLYGKSLFFEAAKAQHLRASGVTTPLGNSFTITSRIKIGSLSENAAIWMHGLSGDAHVYAMWIPTSLGKLNALIEGSGDQTPIASATTNLEDSAYHTITLTVDRVNSLFEFYLDGNTDGITNLDFSGTSVGVINPTNEVYIGKWSDSSSSDFEGEYGFLRYDIDLKSPNYISATHNNLNNPTATGTAPFFAAFGSEQIASDSILYNASQPYNHTISSDGLILINRSSVGSIDTNWTAAAVSADCGFIVTEFNHSNTTIANFTVYTANLDWLKVTNLTADTEYNLTNSTTYEHQIADASSEVNFTTDLIPGDYQILLRSGTTPIITLLSQTPSVICANTTGYLNISYGISHDAHGLNSTSVSFLFRNYDHTLNDANHSIRPPANDKCAVWEHDGQILRAANRNESLNFENNDSITGGDIYTWSGLDENQTRLTIVPVNSTYTIVNINGTIHDLAMEQMWYLDRSSMIDSTKTKLAIHKSQDVLIKFWDAEIFKGNYDFIGVGYTDTSLGALQPSDANPIHFYKLNASYDPLGGVAPLDSPYIVYMGSLNASGWVDHSYSPDGVNYIRGMINNSYIHSIMDTTEIEYLYFTSNTPSSKPYYINITDSASNTNRTFGQTDVLWIGDSAPYTPHPYTPNMWFAFIYTNTSFDHKLYAAGVSGLWSNSTLNRTYIGVGQFPPTKPHIDHFCYDGANDPNMDGYYTGNFTIVSGMSSDPDGGTVTHNLTLHYASNLTLVAIINNTFTDAGGVLAEIAFNSTPYLSDTVQYTLKLVATDDEGDTVETWLGVDFWLAERPATPGFIFEIFVLIIMFAAGMMMYSFLVIDTDNYTHVLAAFLSGIVYILSGFLVFEGVAFYGDDVLLCTEQPGWVAMVFIILGSTMIIYAAVLGIDAAKEVIDELEEST